jgi:hypothetical protein
VHTLDVAQLPPRLTRLEVYSRRVLNSALPPPGAAEGQQGQQHEYPLLLHLDLNMLGRQPEAQLQDARQLAAFRPALQRVRHLGCYTNSWQDGTPLANAAVLAQLAGLRELVVWAPWEGMAQALVQLGSSLTSLEFHGLAVVQLDAGEMVEVALQLPWLKRLAIRPSGSDGGRLIDVCWPADLSARMRHALPGCRLVPMYSHFVYLFGSE